MRCVKHCCMHANHIFVLVLSSGMVTIRLPLCSLVNNDSNQDICLCSQTGITLTTSCAATFISIHSPVLTM